MKRWLRSALGTLMLAMSVGAAACPICFRGMGLTTAQQLAAAKRAVLAVPAQEAQGLRVVAIIKGGGVVGETIQPADLVAPTSLRATRPLLILQGPFSPVWLSGGSVGSEYSEWLRRLAAATPDSNASDAQWHEHVGFMLPYLDSPEPLVAAVAYSELSRAPYAALRTLKPSLDATQLIRWVDDPIRQQLYTLLLGIAGSAQDAEDLEQRLDAAWKAKTANNLGALLAADLELRGPARVAWIETRYLTDRTRTLPEIEAALLALSVQGTADAAVPRARVIEAYRRFMQARKPMAGFVAPDFAAWGYWDAVPEYAALLESGALQDPASRYTVIGYLEQSPRADAKAAIESLRASSRESK
jgi:hypothetical protein